MNMAEVICLLTSTCAPLPSRVPKSIGPPSRVPKYIVVRTLLPM